MTRLADKLNNWMEDAKPRAVNLIAQQPRYRDAMAQLLFYYTRAMFTIHVKGPQLAAAMQIDRSQVYRHCKPRSTSLTRDAIRCVELWASYLAKEGATFREATFVFKRSILETTIEQCQGNRGKAARMLGVHRNTMWQPLPSSPAKIWPGKEGKQS